MSRVYHVNCECTLQCKEQERRAYSEARGSWRRCRSDSCSGVRAGRSPRTGWPSSCPYRWRSPGRPPRAPPGRGRPHSRRSGASCEHEPDEFALEHSFSILVDCQQMEHWFELILTTESARVLGSFLVHIFICIIFWISGAVWDERQGLKDNGRLELILIFVIASARVREKELPAQSKPYNTIHIRIASNALRRAMINSTSLRKCNSNM